MSEIYTMNLDTRISKGYPSMTFVKGDVGTNEIQISLTSNNVALDLTSKTVTFTIRKPDNTEVVYNANITGTNTIEFILDANALASVGTVLCSLEVYAGVQRITFVRFQYKVIDSLNSSDDIASFSDYPVLTALINDVQTAKEDIGTIGSLKDELTTKITDGDALNTNLGNNITTGTTLNNDLGSNINTGTTLKSDLETNINAGNTTKNGLDTSISTGDSLKSSLEADINTAETKKTDLENVIATADTTTYATKGEINTVNSQLVEQANQIATLNNSGVDTTARAGLTDIAYNVRNNISMVSNAIWTTAIQNALDNYKTVYIPYSNTPYIIDDRLLISPGTILKIHPQAVIYLADNTNTCMIRNKNMQSTDSDIVIEGGIWDGNYANNTGQYSYSDKTNPLRGVAGLISMIGVAKYSIRNLVIQNGRGFGIQSCQCSNFVIENIEFKTHQRDGVHISGENNDFIVRNIFGSTKDDFVALNAWDWYNSTPSYGNITNGLIEKLNCNHAGGCAVKVLPGGSYTVDNITVRNVSGISDDASFKIQDDTDLETPSNTISAGSVGKLIYEKISCYAINSCNIFLLGTAIDHLEINDLNINSLQTAPAIIQKSGYITKNLIIQTLKNNNAITTTQIISIPGTIENLMLNHCIFNSINNGGDYFLIGVGSGGRVINMFVNNSRFNQGAGILRTYTGALDCNLQIVNCYFYMLKHTIFPDTTINIKLSNCFWDSIPATNDIVRIDQSGANAIVFSNNCEFINSANAVPFTKVAGSIRWNGTDIPVDVSLLSPNGSDVCSNNNASLSCGKGIVVRDTGNTQWKNLFSGATV